MKFETYKVADVSTAYVEEADLPLLLDSQAPNHLATTDDRAGTFFWTPAKDELEDFAKKAGEFGLSERFVSIIRNATAQRIRYVRFDADGGALTE